jgi:hypothetical protein
MYITFELENVKGRYKLEDVDVYVKIILKWTIEKRNENQYFQN